MATTSERYPGRQLSLVAWGGASSELDRIHVVTTGDVVSPTASEDERGVVDPMVHPDHQIGLDGVVDLYAYPNDAAAWHGGVTGRPLPGAAGSEADYAMIEHWLEQCKTKHEFCPKALETQLPKRVIDVGPVFTMSDPHLVETEGSVTAKYVTLSHCWGGHVPLTTMTATLEDRKRSIALSEMPKTFADAVAITRRLGVRYLWIDSLCILQDSKTDWEEQSAVMCDIYASGYLNIGARAAANATVGCLIPRPPHPPSCHLQYTSTDGAVRGNMYARSPDFRPERLRDSPLDQRGWVLQERILAPRIVYFGADQLYWECSTAVKRQDGKHHDVMTDEMRSGEDFKNVLDVDAVIQPREGSYINPRFWQWYKVVRQYTRCSLTNQTDMLPAISGIAKAYHAKLHTQYVAGMWEQDMIYGLAWRKRRPGEAIEGSTLPTWTWARVTGETEFAGHVQGLPIPHMSALCVMIDVAYSNIGRNPFGEIANAHVRLWGRIIAAFYDPNREVPRSGNEFSDISVSSNADIWDTEGKPVGLLHPDCIDGRLAGSVIHCLLLCLVRKQITAGYADQAVLALQTMGTGPDHFRRVGLISANGVLGLFDSKAPFRDVKPRVVVLV